MDDSLALGVAGVQHGAVAGDRVHVGSHELKVELQLAGRAQVVGVHPVYDGIVELVLHVGADVADGLTAGAHVFVEHPGHAEIPALGFHRHLVSVLVRAGQHHVLLDGPHGAIAQAADLAGGFQGAQQVGGIGQLDTRYGHSLRNLHHRRTADASGVDDLGRLRDEQLAGPSGTGGAAARPEWAGARGGGENFVAFQEEQAFLREKGLRGSEVDHHVVGFHCPEIRVQCGAHLQVGGRPPEDVHPHLPFEPLPGEVLGAGDVGVEVQLSAWLHVLQGHGVQGAHEARSGLRKCGKTEPLVQVAHLAAGIEADPSLIAGARHGHHGPGQEHLRGPAFLRYRRPSIPGAVPFPGVLALRRDLAVGKGIPQGDAEPVAVDALAGGIQGDGHAVPGEEVVPGTEPLHQGVGRLLGLHADVQTFLRIEVAHQRLMARGLQGIGHQHAHVVIARYLRPDRFIQPAIQFEADFLLGEPGYANGGAFLQPCGGEQQSLRCLARLHGLRRRRVRLRHGGMCGRRHESPRRRWRRCDRGHAGGSSHRHRFRGWLGEIPG